MSEFESAIVWIVLTVIAVYLLDLYARYRDDRRRQKETTDHE